MDYFFNDQQQMIKSLARRIAEEKVMPVRAELDEKEEFPWAIIKELANTDMFRVFIPEEYGGLGGGWLDLCLVIEELSRVCSGVAISYAATALGCHPILRYGTAEQKQRYLPDIADGKRLAAFALTESMAGSDAAAIRTSAVRKKVVMCLTAPNSLLLMVEKLRFTQCSLSPTQMREWPAPFW